MDRTAEEGLVGYSFEPEYTEYELETLELHTESGEVHAPPTSEREFCTCDNCSLMDKYEENVCCHNSDLTVESIGEHNCITEIDSFDLIVLHRAVLEVAFIQIMAYKGSRGRAPDELTAAQYRLSAYRQFVSFMMKGERLGKANRIVIPACVVKRIREEYPDPAGQYCGFKSSIDSLRDLF